jgi:C1A family cysteine protease
MNKYHSLGVTTRSYGYRPAPENHPLKLSSPYSHTVLASSPLPLTVDLRPYCLAVRNQENIGACSAFSAASFRELLHWRRCNQVLPGYLAPSYLYWRTRVLEGSFPEDSGCSISDEFSTLLNYGVCSEACFPFNDTCNIPGTPQDDVVAAEFKLKTQPLQVDWSDMTNFEQVLANNLAINIGFTVYQSFEQTGPDGMVPPISGPVMGGHGVLVCGYDHNAQNILIRNQWSDTWALNGYCWMPYAYAQEVLSEAWTVAG